MSKTRPAPPETPAASATSAGAAGHQPKETDMGKRTAESLRHLEQSAREAQKKAAKENDVAGAIYEGRVAADYASRAAKHEQPGAKGW